MQERPAPKVAATRGTGTVALLLVFCCAPVFAAGSDALEQDADADNELALLPPSIATAPRVERILREIFDESLPADQEAAEATPSSSPDAATLAELTAPGLAEISRVIDNIDAAKIREAKQDVSGVTTSVPGLADDELARYRRQMFRTDI